MSKDKNKENSGQTMECERCHRTSIVVDFRDGCPFCHPKPSKECPYGEKCLECRVEVKQEAWEEEFDREFINSDGYPLNIDFANENNLKSFISSLLSSERTKLIEEIRQMKKEAIDPETDLLKPRGMFAEEQKRYLEQMMQNTQGYNNAIGDILDILKGLSSNNKKQ